MRARCHVIWRMFIVIALASGCAIFSFGAASPAKAINLPDPSSGSVVLDDPDVPDVTARVARISFIRGYAQVEFKESGRKELEIELKYHEGRPVIRELKRISTPGRRVYTSVKDLKPHRQGLGVSIVSTPQGVMTDSAAREKNVGGEVLCQVF